MDFNNGTFYRSWTDNTLSGHIGMDLATAPVTVTVSGGGGAGGAAAPQPHGAPRHKAFSALNAAGVARVLPFTVDFAGLDAARALAAGGQPLLGQPSAGTSWGPLTAAPLGPSSVDRLFASVKPYEEEGVSLAFRKETGARSWDFPDRDSLFEDGRDALLF
jgi:hypothetical protein